MGAWMENSHVEIILQSHMPLSDLFGMFELHCAE